MNKKSTSKSRNITNAASSSNKGNHYERRVDSVYLLALLSGRRIAVCPDHRVTAIRFQARTSKIKTDDLVCTLEDSVGLSRKCLMQVKQKLTATSSDNDFIESLTNAWDDYENEEVFDKNRDFIVLVYEFTSGESVRALESLIEYASGSIDSEEFFAKATTVGFSNADNRNLLTRIQLKLEEHLSRKIQINEIYEFLKHWRIQRHCLGARSDELRAQLGEIDICLNDNFKTDAMSVWTKLINAANFLNETVTTTLVNDLKEYIGADVVRAFQSYRLKNQKISIIEDRHLLEEDSTNLHLYRDSINKSLDSIADLIKKGRGSEASKEALKFSDVRSFTNLQKAHLYYLKGKCYWLLGNEEAAAGNFLEAEAIYPDDPRFAAGKVKALAFQKRFDEAFVASNLANNRFQNSAETWCAWASAHVMAKRPIDFNLIPEVRQKDADILQMVALSFLDVNELDEAVAYAMKAIDARDAAFATRNSCLMVVLDAVTKNKVRTTFRLLPSNAKFALSQCLKSFDPRMERVWTREKDDSLIMAVENLSLSYLLLGDYKSSRKIIDECNERGVISTRLLGVELELMFETQEYNSAKTFTISNLNRLDERSRVIIAEYACSNRDVDFMQEVLGDAEEFTSYSERTKSFLKIFHWSVLCNAGIPEQAIDLIIKDDLVNSKDMNLVCHAGEIMCKHGNNKNQVIKLLETAEKIAFDYKLPENVMMFADFLYACKDFARASFYYSQSLPDDVFSRHHLKWMESLIKSEKYPEFSKLISSFEKSWLSDPLARSLARSYAKEVRNLFILLEISEFETVNYPEKSESWCGRILIDDLEKIEGDPEINCCDYLRIPTVLSGEIQNLAFIAQHEISSGNVSAGLNRLYRMRRMHSLNPVSAPLYITDYRRSLVHQPDDFKEADVIADGCSVYLTDVHGTQRVITLDPCDGLEKFSDKEFKTPASAEAKILIGKRVNDLVNFGPFKSYKITYVESSYRRLDSICTEEIFSFPLEIPGLTRIYVAKEHVFAK